MTDDRRRMQHKWDGGMGMGRWGWEGMLGCALKGKQGGDGCRVKPVKVET